MASNTDKLTSLIGFDPAKEARTAPTAYQEVLAEITRERQDKAKAKTKEILLKAMDLRQKNANTVREFNKQQEAFEKELKKLLSQLQQSLTEGAAEVAADTPAEEPEA